MPDYFTLLSRALASLDQNTAEARGMLYQRARAVLADRLRAADPPWPDDRIARETAALDAAIAQIESRIMRSAQTARATQNQIRRPQPRPRMDMESAGDEEQTPRREHSTFSLANISALGAVVLAFIAAGSYTYLSRSAAKPPAAAVHAGASAALKPDVSRQATNIKTAEPAAEKPGDAAGGSLPYGMGRQFVFYRSSYPAGTIIINKPQHTLYQVKAETVAIQYSIGIGPACMDAAGMHRVSDRQEWPQWPPAPPGGAAQVASASAGEHRPESRLGARALFLNDIEYGIHGTDKPGAIGRNSSFGCFLLMDDDIADLYDRTPVDTHVVIMN